MPESSTAAPPTTSTDVVGEDAPEPLTLDALAARLDALDAKADQILTAQTNVGLLIMTVQTQLAPVADLAGRAKARLDRWKAARQG